MAIQTITQTLEYFPPEIAWGKCLECLKTIDMAYRGKDSFSREIHDWNAIAITFAEILQGESDEDLPAQELITLLQSDRFQDNCLVADFCKFFGQEDFQKADALTLIQALTACLKTWVLVDMTGKPLTHAPRCDVRHNLFLRAVVWDGPMLDGYLARNGNQDPLNGVISAQEFSVGDYSTVTHKVHKLGSAMLDWSLKLPQDEEEKSLAPRENQEERDMLCRMTIKFMHQEAFLKYVAEDTKRMREEWSARLTTEKDKAKAREQEKAALREQHDAAIDKQIQTLSSQVSAARQESLLQAEAQAAYEREQTQKDAEVRLKLNALSADQSRLERANGSLLSQINYAQQQLANMRSGGGKKRSCTIQ